VEEKWDKRIEAIERAEGRGERREERHFRRALWEEGHGQSEAGWAPSGCGGRWRRSSGCLTVELVCLLNLERDCSNQETWEWALVSV